MDVVIAHAVAHRLGNHAQPIRRLSRERGGQRTFVRCALNHDIIKTAEPRFQGRQCLLHRFVDCAANRHHLAHRFHGCGQKRL